MISAHLPRTTTATGGGIAPCDGPNQYRLLAAICCKPAAGPHALRGLLLIVGYNRRRNMVVSLQVWIGKYDLFDTKIYQSVVASVGSAAWVKELSLSIVAQFSCWIGIIAQSTELTASCHRPVGLVISPFQLQMLWKWWHSVVYTIR